MCLLYQRSQLQFKTENLKVDKRRTLGQAGDDKILVEIKFKLVKRIQFLNHFLKNPHLNKTKLFSQIMAHLQYQKQQEKNLKTFLNHVDNEKAGDKLHSNLLHKIHTVFLYCFYLEENSIINFVTNPNRLFSNLYFKIDIPTQVCI